MNATYALYFVIRCQLLPGVLLSRHLDRGLIQRFNFQRDCAIHKTATIWGLMLKYFLSFKSIFARLKSKQRMMLKSKLRWMLKSKQRILLKSKLRRKLISITYICQSIMLQGVSTQTFIFHFALTGRNIQVSCGLKVIWES